MVEIARRLFIPGHVFWGTVPAPLVGAFVIALVISSMGFARLVLFISIGYGASVAAIAAVEVVVFRAALDGAGVLLALLVFVYGTRLAWYLTVRERSASFAGERRANDDRTLGAGLGLKLAIWPTVSLLYATMTAPIVFHFAAAAAAVAGGGAGRHAAAGFPVLDFVGIVVGFAGVVIEATADRQKACFKRRGANKPCMIGLYRMVRYPSYFGEILVWVGCTVAGLSSFRGIAQWIIALSGLACIVLIMLGSAKRLEKKQGERYLADPEFAAYVRRVPVLFPLLPLYSLKNLKVYLG